MKLLKSDVGARAVTTKAGFDMFRYTRCNSGGYISEDLDTTLRAEKAGQFKTANIGLAGPHACMKSAISLSWHDSLNIVIAFSAQLEDLFGRKTEWERAAAPGFCRKSDSNRDSNRGSNREEAAEEEAAGGHRQMTSSSV